MKKKLIAALFLAALPLSAAQAMDVATFLTKAEAVEKKGMLAVFSSDYKVLKAEIENASKALRAERHAAQKAGRKPAYCPTGKSGVTVRDILAAMRAVPVAQRPRTQVKDALRTDFARRWPCR